MRELEKIKVSIILPTYNSANFVEATIESVLAQSYQNWELIAIDDASSDDTGRIVQRYAAREPRVHFLQLAKNSGGPARPRNVGLRESDGDLVCFLDSDDLWHPEKLAFQVTNMSRLGLNFSSTKLVSFRHKACFKPIRSLSSVNEEYVGLERLLSKNIFAASSVMLSRALLGTAIFSELAQHSAIEDYLLWLELHQNSQIRSARFSERIVAYRLRDNSISRSKLKMASKLFVMLGQIELHGKRLKGRKYYYFLKYIVGSLRFSMYD